MTEDVPLSSVSYHAVTRYVQRVLGVSVPVDEADVGTMRCAFLHCARAGTNINQVRRDVLERDVICALQNRLSIVRTGRYRAVLDPINRIVITIQPLPVHGRVKVMAVREGRRASHQSKRRTKFRPVLAGEPT